MRSEQRLTVEFSDDSRVDEYRIRNWEVEFRARGADGSALPEWGSQWRQLTADDISLHLVLHTVVGEWLTLRLPQSARTPNLHS